MKVNVRAPKITVLLHKVVTRTGVQSGAPGAATSGGSGAPVGFTSQQYSSSSPYSPSLAGPPSQTDQASNVWDLTSWLGEGSTVHVQKSVREPAGAFSITFVDELTNTLKDGLSYLIEPQDLIEIRFAGEAYKYAGTSGQQLPIIMRGFVSKVRRTQTTGTDGKPRRQVEVTGHDYQKLLQLIQIFNLPGTPEVANMITSFPLFSKYGPELNVMNSTSFVLNVFNLIVNKYIAGMQAAGATSGAALAEVATDIQVPDALVSLQLGAISGGNMQQLLEAFLDVGTFNEFFIEDRDAGPWGPAGPYAVYRPAPYLGAVSRTPLQPIQKSVTSAVDPSSPLAPNANCVTIETDSIISISAERSDEGVANYFWVDAPRFNQNYDDLPKSYAAYAEQGVVPPYYLASYQNVNPALYGLRRMDAETQQGAVVETNAGNGTPAGESRWNNQNAFLGWIDYRRDLLISMNQDNVVFETGSMHLRGNEKIRAGSYVQIDYGNKLKSLYYAHTVSHVFEPFGSFTTSI